MLKVDRRIARRRNNGGNSKKDVAQQRPDALVNIPEIYANCHNGNDDDGNIPSQLLALCGLLWRAC